MEDVILVVGLIFPAISWLSIIVKMLQYVLTKKSSSEVYIPFIGPILIDIWIVAVDGPVWTLVIPWIADIGTIMFGIAMPKLVVEWWQTSPFNRTFVLVGTKANQAVEISFHKGGHYVLQKNRTRRLNEVGVIALSEPGTYEENEDTITLTSHTGGIVKDQGVRKKYPQTLSCEPIKGRQ